MSEGVRALSGLLVFRRLTPHPGFMFDIWHLVKYFWSTTDCKQSQAFGLYFHVNIVMFGPTGYFKLIFEIDISVWRWRTPDQSLATRFLFWHFIHIYRVWVYIWIVGYDVESPNEHYDSIKNGLDNLFIFLIILWKDDEWKNVFPCAALPGCFWSLLIATWIHFSVNKQQECDCTDGICVRHISIFVE